MNTIKGVEASALIYSVVETARANRLNVYFYGEHLITELLKLRDEKGNIDTAGMDQLLPWSEALPERCRRPLRK